MRSSFLILLSLAAGAAACGGGQGSHDKAELPPIEATPAPEPQDEARKEASAATDGASQGGAAGTLEARRRSTLSPKVSGVVEKVHVRDGDVVAENAPLVTLDAEDFALRARQASAGYDAAKAGFTAAEADWKRAKALVADGAMPQAQFEAADARYQAARAQLAQAEVGLAMARKAERDSVVRAPFPGVIVRRYVSEGEYASMMPATNLVTLEETGVFDLRVYVPADAASGVKAGDAATVRIASLGGEIRGKVLQVLPPLETEGGTAAILVEVPDPEGRLRPGVTAEVTLSPRPAVGGGNNAGGGR